jgi:hypothetical protein
MRNLLSVGARTPQAEQPFRLIETVHCLACGVTYAKPRLGGTAATNPGCPECGYLGWSSFKPEEEPGRPRSFADPLRSRLARPR